jgi:WD40 repeat protein
MIPCLGELLVLLMVAAAVPSPASASANGSAKEAGSCPPLLGTLRHSGPVHCVALSPDGRRLAVGNSAGIKVWDLKKRVEIVSLQADGYRTAFSPDGKQLVLAKDEPSEGNVKFWDAVTGKETVLWKLPFGHSVSSFAFSSDGRQLAAAINLPRVPPSVVQIWDMTTRKEAFVLRGHQGEVEDVLFSPDGRWIATADSKNAVKLWDLGTHKQLRSLPLATAQVNKIALSGDGKRLAVASGHLVWGRGTVTVWETATGKQILLLEGHMTAVLTVAFSPDGKRIASGGQDGTVRLWDAATGRLSLGWKGHNDSVTALAFTPDGKTLISGSSDRTVKLWDLKAAK